MTESADLEISSPGLLEDELKNISADYKKLTVKGVLNKADMDALGNQIQDDKVRGRISSVDFSGISGVTDIPPKMFSHCEDLTEVRLPSCITKLGSQAFAYSPSLASVNLNSVTEVSNFDCFAFCRSLCDFSLPKAEKIGKFSFRRSRIEGSLNLPALKRVSACLFMDATVTGDILLPEAASCDEDAFCGVKVSGKIYLPNCTDLGYGLFNDSRMIGSLWLTTPKHIELNARTFTEFTNLKNTTLYLHRNKKDGAAAVSSNRWGGTEWKKIEYVDSDGNVLSGS